MLRVINGFTEPCDATNYAQALATTLVDDAAKSSRLSKTVGENAT